MLKALGKQKSLINDQNEYEMEMQSLSFDVCDKEEIEYKPVDFQFVENKYYQQCRIDDDIITSIDSNEDNDKISISNNYCSNIFIFILFCITLFCNILLIYFIYLYYIDINHDPIILLYISGIACCYLPLCGIYQAFNYPQFKLSIYELQNLVDELIASRPKIKMLITSCNLFIKNKENQFNKIFIHSIHDILNYDDCRDNSDDFNVNFDSLINNKWNIIQFNLNFQIKCGNEQTSKHYLDSRYKFITENVKTTTQKYITCVTFFDDNNDCINNKYIGHSPIEIGKNKQFWIINNKSVITKLLINDTTYWIFSVLLLSQWLYVFIMFALVSKRKNFNICKEIYHNYNLAK